MRLNLPVNSINALSTMSGFDVEVRWIQAYREPAYRRVSPVDEDMSGPSLSLPGHRTNVLIQWNGPQIIQLLHDPVHARVRLIHPLIQERWYLLLACPFHNTCTNQHAFFTYLDQVVSFSGKDPEQGRIICLLLQELDAFQILHIKCRLRIPVKQFP